MLRILRGARFPPSTVAPEDLMAGAGNKLGIIEPPKPRRPAWGSEQIPAWRGLYGYLGFRV